MKNSELAKKIFEELDPTYQIGLHNVCIEHYKSMLRYRKELYFTDKENIKEEDIISKILETGLIVSEHCIGLRSTVNYQGNVESICPDIFNYAYWTDDQEGKAYNLIAIIPSYITINDKQYFIGQMKEFVNIANFSFFYSLLPKEFIYGYYTKEYTSIKKENDDYYSKLFDDNLEFFPNPNFYHFLENKEEFWLQFLKDNKISMSVLNGANYPNIFNNLFHRFRNRHAIKMTREQIKTLKKTK